MDIEVVQEEILIWGLLWNKTTAQSAAAAAGGDDEAWGHDGREEMCVAKNQKLAVKN